MTDSRTEADTAEADTSATESGETDTAEMNTLLSRLRVIEEQPLDSRAPAFATLHDWLQRRLGGDSRSSS